MVRKKWTPQSNINDSVLKFREKRKWQIALRRYVIEENPSFNYAPYFGLDIKNFRKWIEMHFEEEQAWANFGKSWQLEHIIPIIYFDFEVEEDLQLCWNFTNIRIETTVKKPLATSKVDLLGAKSYFNRLFVNTGYAQCKKMVDKISQLEQSQSADSTHQESFIKANLPYVEFLSDFNAADFAKLNQGEAFSNIVLEKEILKKFGS